MAAAICARGCVLVPANAAARTQAAAAGESGPGFYAWGSREGAGLGDNAGQTGFESSPQPVSLADGVVATQISASVPSDGTTTHVLAVGSDRKAYAWGGNFHGPLGDGTQIARFTPLPVEMPGGVDVTKVATGDHFSVALGSDGTVYTWGDNLLGELGDGTDAAFRPHAEAIALAPDVTAKDITASFGWAMAIGSDGKVYEWGSRQPSQIDHNPPTGFRTPHAISLPGGAVPSSVSADQTGPMVLVLASDGSVYAWGCCELGNGTLKSETPELVPLPGGVLARDVSGGPLFGASAVVGVDGNLYTWGDNFFGELGDGTKQSRDTPQAVALPGGVAARSVSVGETFAMALGADGRAYAWGDNRSGQLGDGTTEPHLTPQPVDLPDGVIAATIEAGNRTAFVTYSLGELAPLFARATPPRLVSPSFDLAYQFRASGFPHPTFALAPGAPNWLHIDPTTGVLTGTVPEGAPSFSFSVVATNHAGSATAGPYTVDVVSAAPVTGRVVKGADATPVASASVESCIVDGGVCDSATTGPDGLFAMRMPTGATVTLTAFPPPGADVSASRGPLVVPSAGLDLTIKLSQAAALPTGVNIQTLPGDGQPSIHYAAPTPVSVTGCPNGLAAVTVIGPQSRIEPTIVFLTETPPGSGVYTGTIPPFYPHHGPASVQKSIECPPTSSLAPTAGPSTGGNSVVVTGTGFAGATGVAFGGTPATSFEVAADEAIRAIAPAGTGTVDVTVRLASGQTVTADPYTYVGIQSISPATGPETGGTEVTIVGTGLGAARGVLFGDTPSDFVQVSDTELRATSPPGTGTQQIVIMSKYGGLTPVTPAAEFSYGDTAPATLRPASVSRSAAGLSGAEPRFGAPSLSTSGAGLGALAKDIRNAVVQNPTELIKAVRDKVDIKDLRLVLPQDCDSQRERAETDLKIRMQKAIGPSKDVMVAVITGLVMIQIPALLILEFVVAQVVEAVVDMLLNFIVDLIAHVVVLLEFSDCVDASPAERVEPNLLIDPSGTVLNRVGNPVGNASVTILRSDSIGGPYAPVDTTKAGIEPAVNPEMTAADGVFHWDVSTGFYEVQATAPGCNAPDNPAQPAVTIGPYPVPPPQVGLVITMACTNEGLPPTPAVDDLTQKAGPPGGGTAVTVLGSGFTPSSTVTFGGVAAGGVTFLSSQALAVVTPPGMGVVDVVVHNGGESSAVSAADRFSYGSVPMVTDVSPGTGPASGGNTVTVSGSGFDGTTTVGFGGLPATTFTVESSSEIKATAPPQPPGTVHVSVLNAHGASATSAADQYIYQDDSTSSSTSSTSSTSSASSTTSSTSTSTSTSTTSTTQPTTSSSTTSSTQPTPSSTSSSTSSILPTTTTQPPPSSASTTAATAATATTNDATVLGEQFEATPSEGLASTGAVFRLLWAGAALLVLGVIFASNTRRRRRR